MVRQPDATMQPTPQDDQLMSKHRVLSFKPHLRLEWRCQHGQSEAEQPNHHASLDDSSAASHSDEVFGTHTLGESNEAKRRARKVRQIDTANSIPAPPRIRWAATSYGVECRDVRYVVERARLWQDEDWVRHTSAVWKITTGRSIILLVPRKPNQRTRPVRLVLLLLPVQ
jgi:hypothetical protein